MDNPTTDPIKLEIEKLIVKTKESLAEVKKIAVAEAWKIMQLAIASVIQTIERLGTDLSSQDKKLLAMTLLSGFYDKVFLVVDVPFVPNIIEPMMHKYIKSFLMILVGASIDAMVTTFRNAGIFLKQEHNA